MIRTYRKKPINIEAIQWDGNNFEEIQEFCKPRRAYLFDPTICGSCKENERLMIDTLEGIHEARKGDYIIKGVKGECYPCKPDIFRETYIEVNV